MWLVYLRTVYRLLIFFRVGNGGCVSLHHLAFWDCGFESRRGTWMPVYCECCFLEGRGLCVGPITRLEVSYRVCMCH
jgi:hypothetical protein